MPLVEAPVVPDLPQRPPHGLDVFVAQGDVRIVEIDPEADPLGESGPVVDVAEDRLAALLVELGDAVGLDLVLLLDAELALDLELHGQPVAVPARLPGNPVAAHSPVARIDVLEDPGEHVV